MENDVLRTKENLERYFANLREHGQRITITEDMKLRVFRYWFVIENIYPYDKIAEVHHLLFPCRVFADEYLMHPRERRELMQLKALFAREQTYDAIVENMPHQRTVPSHYHLHCIKYKNITHYDG